MIFWKKFMYHQNTLKIFLPQYLGMFGVYDIFSANRVLIVCMAIPGENTWNREPKHFMSEYESGHIAGCGEDGCPGMFEWDFNNCF